MPLDVEVGLGPGDCVRLGPSYTRKKAHPPHPFFGPCLLWPNSWMDEVAAWYGRRPRPTAHCTRRGPSSRERGTALQPPLFGPCLLWPRSPVSATAELSYKRLPKKSRMTIAPKFSSSGVVQTPDVMKRSCYLFIAMMSRDRCHMPCNVNKSAQ